MEANNILTANLLDILFEGRNKDYGAYDLRKSYNKRISISLVITLGIIASLLLLSAIAKDNSLSDSNQIKGPDIVLKPFTPEPPPLPPRPPVLPPPPVATIAYTTPVVAIDDEVIIPPPEIKELTGAVIELKTVEGTKGIGFVNPPVEPKGTQVVATPVVKKNIDSIYLTVEIDASFPGGINAWSKYVKKTIERNIDELSESDLGTCIVQFIVDKSGKVSDVQATTLKGTKLAEIAENAIRKGPNWIPAQQNGSYVNAYRRQPVTLKNPNE